jgi:hypothetical protein
MALAPIQCQIKSHPIFFAQRINGFTVKSNSAMLVDSSPSKQTEILDIFCPIFPEAAKASDFADPVARLTWRPATAGSSPV